MTDPEKAVVPRDTAEIERPLSIHSDSTDSEPELRDPEKHDGLEKVSSHRDGVFSSTIVGGEPVNVADAARSPLRSLSRASSVRSRPLSVVPRSKRRGLFARLAVVPEVDRPYDYKNSTKWGITLTIALATAAAPLGSSIFYPALPLISAEFGVTETISNLSVAMYMIAMSIFPLWWSSFSEQFGRRTIYLISFFLFVVFSVISALSVNISMLIVFRIFSGGASASVQAVGAGTIADIWESYERGRAMGWFYLGPLLGPVIAPIVGGVLSQELGWRATMWFLAIYGLVIWIMLLFLLPETLARRKREETVPAEEDLRRMRTTESAKVRTKKFAAAMKRTFIEPLSVLLFLRFPPVLVTVLVSAIAFGSLFVANISLQHQYAQSPYNYKQIIIGLLYIPPGLGYFTASLFGGRWIDKIMAREARKANRYDEQGKLIYLPEDRMRENMWLAHTVYPLSLLAYGWTLNYGVHFMAPSVFLFLFGCSSMLVFAAATTMLTEFVRKKSSAGVAVNNFVRNILSCVGTVVAAPWINAIGVGWVFTAICIFCMIFGSLGIFLLRRNASKWRKAMDEALEQSS